MHFRKSNSCSNKLDVLEAKGSHTQFNRVRGHILRRWFTHGRYSAVDLWDLGIVTTRSPEPGETRSTANTV